MEYFKPNIPTYISKQILTSVWSSSMDARTCRLTRFHSTPYLRTKLTDEV